MPTAPSASTLAQRVRSAREAAGMTRDILAPLADTSVPTIARIELLNHMPRAATLARIAAVLGISVADLVPAADAVALLEQTAEQLGVSVIVSDPAA